MRQEVLPVYRKRHVDQRRVVKQLAQVLIQGMLCSWQHFQCKPQRWRQRRLNHPQDRSVEFLHQ